MPSGRTKAEQAADGDSSSDAGPRRQPTPVPSDRRTATPSRLLRRRFRMTLSLPCPACGRPVDATAPPASGPVRCPHCAAPVPAPTPGRTPGPPGRGKGRLLLAGGLLLALVAAGVAVYVFCLRQAAGPDADNPYVRRALPPGYRPTLKIPLPQMPPADFKTVLYPSNPSPFVLVKTDLWDLKAGRQLGSVSYKVGPTSAQA